MLKHTTTEIQLGNPRQNQKQALVDTSNSLPALSGPHTEVSPTVSAGLALDALVQNPECTTRIATLGQVAPPQASPQCWASGTTPSTPAWLLVADQEPSENRSNAAASSETLVVLS